MIELPESYLNRLPRELSGGQKQRVCIARALAAAPDLIICDEVTSALDHIVQEEILTLLIRLQRELGIAYLFITHDIETVRAIADEIGAVLMYDAAHMGGMIAGGQFQQPLVEGAHVMTGSTYKSLGGPAAGFVATNDAGIAEQLDRERRSHQVAPQHAEAVDGVPQQRVRERAFMLGGAHDGTKRHALALDLVSIGRLAEQRHLVAAAYELAGNGEERVQVPRAAQRDNGKPHRRGPPQHWNAAKSVTLAWCAKHWASRRAPAVMAK